MSEFIRMAATPFTHRIWERIDHADKTAAFIVSDFLDIADYQTSKKTLSRFADNGQLRRVLRGIYDRPQYSSFLGEHICPSPEQVAYAIARNNHWTIAPSGSSALNKLGLSTQVPARWIFSSDGPYKDYDMGGTLISFKHCCNRDISNLAPKTALLVQALKALGAEHIDSLTIRHLSSLYAPDDKRLLLTDAKQTTGWVYKTIQHICRDKQ